jgi:hypothetical protein
VIGITKIPREVRFVLKLNPLEPPTVASRLKTSRAGNFLFPNCSRISVTCGPVCEGGTVRAALPIDTFCLLSPNLGPADESRRAPPPTLGRRTQEANRLRRIKQRFDPLEQSRGTR